MKNTALLIALAFSSCGGTNDTQAEDAAAEETAVEPVADGVPDAPPDETAEEVGEEDLDAAGEEAPPTECGTGSPEALMLCVDAARYQADLLLVAGGARPHGSGNWQDAQDMCAARMEELGYAVELHAYGTGTNVVGTMAGTGAPAERVVLSAHYDSIDGCPGADDNGSGVAGLLESARVLAMAPHRRTLVVACWDEEEDGLVGSDAYAARAITNGETIVVSYVYEMIGYKDDAPNSQQIPAGLGLLFPAELAWIEAHEYKGDFIAIVPDNLAHDPAALVKQYADRAGLPSVVIELTADMKNSFLFADMRRSDHAPFWMRDIPAMMITDTANFRNHHYHCADGDDTVETLDAGFAAGVIRATIASVSRTLDSI